MTTHFIRSLCLATTGACLLSLYGAPSANAQEGFGERIGARLDRGIERLTEEFSERWETLQKTVDTMGVEARVYSRLRWDKQLTDSEFRIDAEEGGIVTLTGRVASAAAKKKAITLANDTVGVNRVEDQLRVEPLSEPLSELPAE